MLHTVDWLIVATLLTLVFAIGLYARGFNRSVADFLAANRCAGPYLLAIAEGIAGSGAIIYIAHFEMYYNSGFSAFWWSLMGMPVGQILALTGWIIYRYRQSRVMTIAQFFELRYSKNFRIFMGIVAFLSGIINFGIFPAIAGKFFLYFCGFPETFTLFGITISTFIAIMFILLIISLILTFLGGQIAVMTTDFLQGIFTYIALIVIIVVLFWTFDWSQINEIFTKPETVSMVNPFAEGNNDFNFFFFMVSAFGMAYTFMAWQGNSGYNCAAKNPHSARIGRILGTWRHMTLTVITIMLPIAAYIVMNSSRFPEVTNSVNSIAQNIPFDKQRDQLITPLVLTRILPTGVVGAFLAVMVAAFISNFDTYLHSWGSIFMQDVILPFRKKPFSQKTHMLLLRLSIIGVAVFIFLFSIIIKQTQHTYVYLYLTGAIYTGGAGAVIIGGFYWKKGTPLAAWVSMILGSSIAVFGVVIHQLKPDFPIGGMWIWFTAMISASLSYIIISLLDPARDFNLDKLLHRGKFAIKEDQIQNKKKQTGFFKKLGLSDEFNFIEKLIYFGTILWTFGWITIFMIGTILSLTIGIEDQIWANFWKGFLYFSFGLVVFVTSWLTIGGLKDMKSLFAALRKAKINALDDGMVVDHHNLEDEELTQAVNKE